MQKKLLDILACPIDKHYPLELIELTINGETIVDGVLLCGECKRFYPIIDEIPVMLPDELRNKNEDIEFLRKWKDRLPQEAARAWRPQSLVEIT
jgi:uncharacterized protein YbaR (Trm112 family)